MSTQIDRISPEVRNICAGPVGAVYDYYIERPWLARLVLGVVWGVDSRPFYRSMNAIAALPEGATILDVPCGGGVAMRGLRHDQKVNWIGVDAMPAMLRRAKRRAARWPVAQAQFIEGDMMSLPLEDDIADLCLTYNGLHCIANPQGALAEMARCLRSGGLLVGTTFLADGRRRQRHLLRGEGFGPVPAANRLKAWLEDCGLSDVSVDREDGLAVFTARQA